jgi:hypothetical protein
LIPELKALCRYEAQANACASEGDEVFYQKLNYIHMNPVVSGFVNQPEDWLYSSARDYAGLSGLVKLAEN